MIIGIGVDIVDNKRFQHSVDRFGDRLLTKIFTSSEIEFSRSITHPERHHAARFASKEALSKAIGSETIGVQQWKNVEVFFHPDGKPEFKFHDSIAERFKQYSIYFSLTLSELQAMACVVVQLP